MKPIAFSAAVTPAAAFTVSVPLERPGKGLQTPSQTEQFVHDCLSLANATKKLAQKLSIRAILLPRPAQDINFRADFRELIDLAKRTSKSEMLDEDPKVLEYFAVTNQIVAKQLRSAESVEDVLQLVREGYQDQAALPDYFVTPYQARLDELSQQKAQHSDTLLSRFTHWLGEHTPHILH